MKKIPQLYLYDPKTKEFIGQRDAAARPGGRGYTLQATFATPVVPPDVPEGYAARWTGEAWELVEDHRQKIDAQGRKHDGTAYWLTAYGDTWQSQARYTEELGPLPDGASTTKPEKPAPTLEERAIYIRAERDRRIGKTDYLVTVDYPLDAEKQELVKTYRQALRDIPQQEGFPWSGEVDDPAIPWPVLDEAATTALR